MPSKPPDILDREREWELLNDVWDRNGPQLVFVIGQRRVGKSYVLSRFANEVEGVYYQATKNTDKEQRATISSVIGKSFGDAALQSGAALPSWDSILEYLTRRAGRKPLLVVIDEFPYLTEAAPALPSIIQKFWDHEWRSTQIRLVLSGSYISAMTRLEEGDQPLFGRRTGKAVFAPFTYLEASQFTPGYSVKDRLLAYGIFGGLPGNLALQDTSRTLLANVSRNVLDAAGRLADDAQHLIDAFLGDSSVYYAILKAIASGEHTWKGIASRVGRTGGSVLRPLQWLQEMGLIEKVVPLTETNPSASRRTQYRVADPYVRFWQRIISPLLNLGMLGLVEPERLWSEWVKPRLDDYMGPVFEGACRDFVRAGRRLPFEPLRVGEWWDASSTNQVDIVSFGGKGEMLVGECKWGRITSEDLDLLRRRSSLVAAELDHQPPRTYLALFSASGKFEPAVRRASGEEGVLLFSADDLFGGTSRRP